MAELSDITKAHTDWQAAHGEDVVVYGEGLMYASVCSALDPDATDAAMAERPAGTRGGWHRSADPTFAGGEPVGGPCDQYPDTRRHYLYEA